MNHKLASLFILLSLLIPSPSTVAAQANQPGCSHSLMETNAAQGPSPETCIYVTTSDPAYDGWVLESTETSNKGGAQDSAQPTFQVGDDATDKQYRAILSFDTSVLPESAVIDFVVLKIRKHSLVGANPFKSHQKLVVDIRKRYFGPGPALDISDFQAGAGKRAVGYFGTWGSNDGWRAASLPATAFPYINRTGITQFRLRFQKDDDDDRSADYLVFFSGNTDLAGYRPVLSIYFH